MRKLIPMMLAALLVPVAGYPLGLGEIRLHSALNQPLSAEIDLLSVDPEDLASLTAGLASSDVFAQLGVDRSSTLLLINFEVVRRPDGSYVVKATSRQPIRDPYLDFLLEVNWKSGRALREYTVLLDPPELMREAPASIVPPMAATTEAEPSVAAEGDAAAAQPEAAQAGADDSSAEPVASASPAPVKPEVITYGPVKANDTLWSIAKRMRPNRSVRVPQVMAALVRSNPYAFDQGNANRLKAGHVLRLDPAQLASIGREEAAREIAVQDRAWQDYRKQAAARAAARTPTSAPASQGSAVAAAPKEEPRLKLVAPEAGDKAVEGKAAAPSIGSKDADALRNELLLAIETSEAQKQENTELRQRIQELQGQLDSMKRLLALKDDDMAALQRQASQVASQTGSAAGEIKATPAEAQNADAGPAVAAPAERPEAATVTPMAPAKTPAPAKAAPAKPANAQPAPLRVPEPSFIGNLTENPLFLGLAGFSVVLLAVAGLLMVRRRRSCASFQESILMGGSPSMAEAKAAEGAPREETSFFSDFAVSGMGDIHAEDSEVDPLTEADVYMAYQRFQQAEELLREAMKNNDRPELHAKLLEVFHATRNEAGFVAEAERLNQMVSGKGPLWEKALALGHELLPHHALFAQAPRTAAPAPLQADARLDDEVLDIGLDLDALTEEMESEAANPANDFNLDLDVDFSELNDPVTGAPVGGQPAAKRAQPADAGSAAPELDPASLTIHLEAPAAPEPGEAHDLELNLDGVDFQQIELGPVAGNREGGRTASEAGSGDLDLGEFDLGNLDFEPRPEEGPAAGAAPATEAAATGSPATDTIELADIDNLQFEAEEPGVEDEDPLFANLDEAGTKLDLARAYMEMGDPEGARTILDEVVQEGNPAQQEQARELLKQIA